jgi:hypothetical protein
LVEEEEDQNIKVEEEDQKNKVSSSSRQIHSGIKKDKKNWKKKKQREKGITFRLIGRLALFVFYPSLIFLLDFRPKIK